MGRALVSQGHTTEAEAFFAQVTPLACTDDDITELAVARAVNLVMGLDQPDAAETVLQRAEAALGTPARRDDLTVLRANFVLLNGHCGHALDAAEGLLADPHLSQGVALQARVATSSALALAGRPDDAVTHAERGLAHERLAPQAATAWGHLQLEGARATALCASGRFDEADTIIRAGYAHAVGEQATVAKALWASWAGQLALARGRVRTARGWLREAVAVSGDHDQLAYLPTLLADLAHTHTWAGDPTAAATVWAHAQHAGASALRLFRMYMAMAQPWVVAGQGQSSRAVQLALDAAAAADELGQTTLQVVALHTVIRLGAPERAAPALIQTAGGMQGHLGPLYADHARALAGRDGPGLERVARRGVQPVGSGAASVACR